MKAAGGLREPLAGKRRPVEQAAGLRAGEGETGATRGARRGSSDTKGPGQFRVLVGCVCSTRDGREGCRGFREAGRRQDGKASVTGRGEGRGYRQACWPSQRSGCSSGSSCLPLWRARWLVADEVEESPGGRGRRWPGQVDRAIGEQSPRCGG